MSRTLRLAVGCVLAGTFLLCPGCPGTTFTAPPVQTGFSFTNFSKSFYATVGLREHRPSGEEGAYFLTPLLPPGATLRGDFFAAVGNGCPSSIDLRLLLYRRINDDLPIGLDPGEEVEPSPTVAGELLAVPYCDIAPLVSFTIVNWDAPPGSARVKLAQDTAVDTALRESERFPNVDSAWELDSVDPALFDTSPPPLAEIVSIAGRVTLADGTAVAGVGVLLRTRFRVRLDDADVTNDPDAGFGDPIAFTTTDENGFFSLDRPAGGYQVEFFSDDYDFRPAVILIEAPISVIQTIAESL